MWFEQLVGFVERSPDRVRDQITVDGEVMTSAVNGRTLICGKLDTPSLAELRSRCDTLGITAGQLRVQEVVGDAHGLHADPSNEGALFQVASQFNLLEMISPAQTPDNGVGIYEFDLLSQGPACAIAAGAGTIYRNYFVNVDGQIGQSANRQIDCLKDLGQRLGNENSRLWTMQNGYALATSEGLREITRRLSSATDAERDDLRSSLRIGLQLRTQVTLGKSAHLVSQAYCSALPVAYSEHSSSAWAEFARLVLEASYEATICAAILNRSRKVFLTFLGGGAFGNNFDWIEAAIRRALTRYSTADLDVAIVSYRVSRPHVRRFVEGLVIES